MSKQEQKKLTIRLNHVYIFNLSAQGFGILLTPSSGAFELVKVTKTELLDKINYRDKL